MQEVNTELESLKATVELQGRAIVKLTTIKADIIKKNNDAVDEMNVLVGQQKEQVNSFQNMTKTIEQNVLDQMEERVDEKVEQVSQDFSFKSMKDQAFKSRHNLIITGLEENSDKTAVTAAKDFCRTIGVNNINLTVAQRLGSAPQEGSSYCRLLLLKFSSLADRNRVWRKRMTITSEDGGKIRIQADLPKQLREGTNILYRITRAAAVTKKYKSITVRNYALQLDGKEYSPFNLESLPYALRPSTISNPRSKTALAFFSKYSILSNHHPSVFTLEGQKFHSMEQFLAYERAKLSEDEGTVQRAKEATDPIKAKAILNDLRNDHADVWTTRVEDTTIKGLRGKFTQNGHLLSFLRNTIPLQLGEASQNERWGTGFNLNSPEVLDTSKWNPTGNLLGRCLMKVRQELCTDSEEA